MMANLVDINDTSHVKPFINWREWRSKQCYLYKTSHSKFYFELFKWTDFYSCFCFLTTKYLPMLLMKILLQINISLIYQFTNMINVCFFRVSVYVVINAFNLCDRLESILFFVENVCLMCDESCLETYLI